MITNRLISSYTQFKYISDMMVLWYDTAQYMTIVTKIGMLGLGNFKKSPHYCQRIVIPAASYLILIGTEMIPN